MKWTLESLAYEQCVWWCFEQAKDGMYKVSIYGREGGHGIDFLTNSGDRITICPEYLEPMDYCRGGHFHIRITPGDAKPDEMTEARLRRILFLMRMGMEEGPWPPM